MSTPHTIEGAIEKVENYIFELETLCLQEFGRIPIPKTAVKQWVAHIAETARREVAIEDIQNWGFYKLVGATSLLLNSIYPLDVFDGSSGDLGPRFTAKLHEAMGILPQNIKDKGLSALTPTYKGKDEEK